MIGTAAVFLISEISSVFMSFRGMMLDPKSKNCLMMLNQVLFFITFTVFRIIIFPLVGLYILPPIVGIWPHVSVLRKICFVISLLLGAGVYFLNLFWYYLIIKHLNKLCKESS